MKKSEHRNKPKKSTKSEINENNYERKNYY